MREMKMRLEIKKKELKKIQESVGDMGELGEKFGWVNGKDYTHLLRSDKMTDVEFTDYIISLKMLDHMDWSKDAIQLQMDQINNWFNKESAGASKEEIEQLEKIRDKV
jgi:hypothetical protein